MRVVNWNIERRSPTSWQGRELSRRIASAEPEIVCLTEAYDVSLDAIGGHSISTKGVVWSSVKDGERKVVLWSRQPWEEEDPVDPEAVAAGACLSAVTSTSIGRIRIIGVCMPYHFASPAGLEPRARPWTQQISFLRAFGPLLKRLLDQGLPTILLGDFNQYVPRIWGSKQAEAAMIEALQGLDVATIGRIPVVERPTIDHVAHSHDLQSRDLMGIDEHMPDGRALSDHFGVRLEFGFL